MYYVGVDLHKRTSWFCILDSEGHKIKSKNVNSFASTFPFTFPSGRLRVGLKTRIKPSF